MNINEITFVSTVVKVSFLAEREIFFDSYLLINTLLKSNNSFKGAPKIYKRNISVNISALIYQC